jgi:hypothetical protein
LSAVETEGIITFVAKVNASSGSTLENNELLDSSADWELYLVNGPQQHKDVLRFGVNSDGYGDIASNPKDGGHKMAEAKFNEHHFTEVLAVGNDGTWAHIKPADGGAIPASDAFKVGASYGYILSFSDGTRDKDSPGNDPWGAKSNHGPFFVDVNHRGRVEAGQWMWCDAEFSPGRPRMGKILGTKGSCFADENGGFVWRWLGRTRRVYAVTVIVSSGHVAATNMAGQQILDLSYSVEQQVTIGQIREELTKKCGSHQLCMVDTNGQEITLADEKPVSVLES